MANKTINEVGQLIGELASIDRELRALATSKETGDDIRIGSTPISSYVVSKDLRKMMFALALNYLTERRANIVERLENDYKLRDTA